MIITATFLTHNYGAVLQAFALQRYIMESTGEKEVYCLDYKPEYLISHLIHKRNGENLIKWIAHNAITLPYRKKDKMNLKVLLNNIFILFR